MKNYKKTIMILLTVAVLLADRSLCSGPLWLETAVLPRL